MARIEEEIKQKKFKSEYQKLAINMLFTCGWITNIQGPTFKEHGITGPQYNILRILRGQYPNPATINLLIDRMIDKMSNASRIVDKLVAKELVERKTSNSDRRAVDVIITQKGLDLLANMDDSERRWYKTFETLTKEEAKTLNELLDKLRG